MDNTQEPEDELKANNAVLKLKLELEHGMKMNETEGLSPEAENQWLQYIYNFEKLSKETARTKVYDFIGRPAFIPLNELIENSIAEELEKLEALLLTKSVVLDRCCEYDASMLYRFITEELFEHEMDGIHMEGMIHHFSYEEFHPNNDYDIRRLTTDFIDSVIARKWNEQFDSMALAENISFNGTDHNSSSISALITTFQEANPECWVEHFIIDEVILNREATKGSVKAKIAYTLKNSHDSPQRIEGNCLFEVVLEYGYWNIALFRLPGIN